MKTHQYYPDISITQIIQIHFRYFHFRYFNSTSGFSKSMQIPHLYFLLVCYTVIEHVEIPIFRSVIWYLGYTYSYPFETFTIG